MPRVVMMKAREPEPEPPDERKPEMAQYLVLIYEDEAAFAQPGVPQEVMAAHNTFGETHGAALAGGNALQPASTATTIRGGVVTDGPFAETKEALGGYYLINADDLDAAIAIAKDCPAKFGGVEVRPIMTFE